MGNYFKKTQFKPIYGIFFILVVAFAGLSYFHTLIKTAAFSGFGDFGNYYFYSKVIPHHNIYTMEETTFHQLRIAFNMPNFVHPSAHSPAFFFLLGPITNFDFQSASIIWLILNNLLLFSSIFIILKLAGEKFNIADKNFLMGSALFMVFSFQPLIENIHMGQNNILILFFFSMALYCLSKKMGILCAVMLSLGIIMKPSFIILLPFFLWKRCYRVFFTTLILLALAEFLPIFLYGKETVFSYWFIGAKGIFLSNLDSMSLANLSLPAIINRISNLSAHPDMASIIISASLTLSLFLFLYVLYVTRRKFIDFDGTFIMEFSLVLLLLFIICPIVHEHHYILLYLPIIAVWARLCRERASSMPIIFVLSFLLIALRYSLVSFDTFHSGFLSIFSGFKLYGVMILFFLTAHIINKDLKQQ
jgi:hypothetical protein